MRTKFGFAILAVMFAGNGAAQDNEASNAVRVTADVRQASAVAGVPVDQSGVAGFLKAAKIQGPVTANVYGLVPSNVRVQRMSRYLTAKAMASREASTQGVKLQDLPDFHWDYIAKDVGYAPVRYQSTMPASLVRIESADTKYEFQKEGVAQLTPGAVVLLPITMKDNDQFTVTFAFDKGIGIWTGTPDVEVMRVSTATDSRGCEIVVNSRPDKATVYFNGKPWREVTNTRPVILQPGTWEVVVKLAGHKDWREERYLPPGGKWEANAKLRR